METNGNLNWLPSLVLTLPTDRRWLAIVSLTGYLIVNRGLGPGLSKLMYISNEVKFSLPTPGREKERMPGH